MSMNKTLFRIKLNFHMVMDGGDGIEKTRIQTVQSEIMNYR